jgi:hypothetical protein
MTPEQDTKLAELEANTARTPEEETLRTALLELDERCEALTAAQAANPTPAPDPVSVAQAAVDEQEKVVADAEAAVVPTPPVPAV